MPLFGPPNIEKLKAKGDVKGLVKALRHKDANVREKAASALEDFGTDAVEPLFIAELDIYRARKARTGAGNADDDDSSATDDVVGVLKKVGTPAVEFFIALLEDRDGNMRELAAIYLGNLKDARAVEPLIAALKHPEAETSVAAGFGLAMLKDPRAVDPLIAALKHPKAVARTGAAFILMDFEDSRAVDPLIAALKDADAEMRGTAAFALGGLEDRRAVEPLSAALADQNEWVWGKAMEALEKIGGPEAERALAEYRSRGRT